MYVLLSPSKRQDMETPLPAGVVRSMRDLTAQTDALVALMAQKSEADIAKLMGVSDRIAAQTVYQFQQMAQGVAGHSALFTFKGDVYDKIPVADYTPETLAFAQKHVGILSGLYGLLRPLDDMWPYRLEMGLALPTDAGKNLYQFWGDQITDAINARANGVVVNLASQEYAKVINPARLTHKLLHVDVKQRKNGKVKTIAIMAKRARGLVADYIIQNQITDPADLLNFNAEGYVFAPEESSEDRFVFVCDV